MMLQLIRNYEKKLKIVYLLQDCTLEIPFPAPCKLESKLWLFRTVTGELTLLLTAVVLGIRARLGILLRSLSKRENLNEIKITNFMPIKT